MPLNMVASIIDQTVGFTCITDPNLNTMDDKAKMPHIFTADVKIHSLMIYFTDHHFHCYTSIVDPLFNTYHTTHPRPHTMSNHHFKAVIPLIQPLIKGLTILNPLCHCPMHVSKLWWIGALDGPSLD